MTAVTKEWDEADDVALLRRLRADESGAITTLMRRYTESLLRFALYLVGSRDAAEDIVQHVFVQLWERRAIIDPECHLKPYLFRSVRNRALDEQDALGVRNRYRDHIQADAAAGAVLSLVPNPEEAILTETMVQAALDRLPERRRIAVRLRLMESMTHAEIANVLGITPVAAQSLVTRGIADLKKIIWRA